MGVLQIPAGNRVVRFRFRGPRAAATMSIGAQRAPEGHAVVERLLLFGGSFDPVHHGHLIVARHVAEALGHGRVLLIPCATPPHKQARNLATAADRVAMCQAATKDESLFAVSDWETKQTGTNYTLHTVQHFQAALGSRVELSWLLGLDSLCELDTWYRADELADACTLVTAARPGFVPPAAGELEARFTAAQVARLLAHIVPGPQIDISATEIRARVRAGRSIRYLVPEAVADYIAAHALYAADGAG